MNSTKQLEERKIILPAKDRSIYIIGALKNESIPSFANVLVENGFDPFADWFTPGPEADQFLLKYARERGWSYEQALNSYAATHIFNFDKGHLDRCTAAVLLMPAGKSAHLELGYVIGSGKRGYILFEEEPERFDLMYKFATRIFFNEDDLIAELKSFTYLGDQ